MSSDESTDALVALYVLAHFPEEPPPAQALDSKFFSGLREFVAAIQAQPQLLPKNASSAADILAHVEKKSNKLGELAAQIKNSTPRQQLSQLEQGEFLGYVVPTAMPEPIQERKSLVELNLITQQEPISRLLSGAHKTLRTEHYKLSLIEGKLGIIFNRIEELKNNDRWSLRQREPFKAPPRPKVHREFFVEESQWMAQCFREERKFRVAMDHMLARAAADVGRGGLHSLTEGERRRQAARDAQAEREAAMADGHDVEHQPNPTVSSIVPCGELPLVASAFDDFSQLIFGGLKTHDFSPAAQFSDGPGFIPVSKFLVLPEDLDWQSVVLEKGGEIPTVLVPQEPQEHEERMFGKYSGDVRAPKPPDARYLNYRMVTIWLPDDDKRLLEIAKEMGYNWELVSSYLMAGLSYKSDIERRTAWQCFERWLQLNPSFDVKDLKGRYAEPARIWLDSSSKAQVAVKRRISPVGVSADNMQRGHKRLRWSSMFDAMRKVKRKRETQPKANVRRQAVESTQGASSHATPTAAELSRMKAERDRAVAEAYAQEQRQGRAGGAAAQRVRPRGAGPSASGANAHGATSAQGAPSAPPGIPGAGPVPGGPTAPTQPTATPTIAGLPVPSSVAAAASQYTPEQLQAMLERRRTMQRQQQQQAQAQAQAAQGAAQAQSAAASSGSATPTYYSPQMQHASPRPGAPPAGPTATGTPVRRPQFSREQIANLMHTIAQKFPNLTREQVQQRAQQELNLYIQKRTQQAQAQAQAAAQQQAAQAQAAAHAQAQVGNRSATPHQGQFRR